MNAFYLITYQMNLCTREPRIANCVSDETPGNWLLRSIKDYGDANPVLLYSVEISMATYETLKETL